MGPAFAGSDSGLELGRAGGFRESFPRFLGKASRLARARVDTIRLKLPKIGALVQVSVRRVWVKLSSYATNQTEFREAHAALSRCPEVVM